MTATTAPSLPLASLSPTAALRRLVSGRTWRHTAQLLSGLFAGSITFSLTVVWLSVAAGTVVVFPLAVAFSVLLVASSRSLGWAERYRARTFLDIDLPSPHRPETGRNLLNRHWGRLRRASTWKEIGYHLLRLPLGAVLFAAALLIWCVPLTLLALPLYSPALPSDRADLWILSIYAGPPAVVAAVIGLIALLFVPLAIGVLARLDEWVIRGLLGPSKRVELASRVAELETSRTGVVDAAEAERRRIERDLHDGAQQRLVALAMNLGMAREKLASDPAAASRLLDEAHAEAKQTLVELRNLARGIHPAVLTDRGLDAALSAVAARSPIPVDLTTEVAGRLAPSVEGTAYFIVSEALANVVKHSGASRCSVQVVLRGSRLVIEVADNGQGGASPEFGTGLAGLRDRVAGLDGWLHLSSPAGGPTTLLVELPCAS